MNRINLMTLAFALLLISTIPLNYGMIVNNNSLFAIGMILIIGACLLYSMALFSILYKRNVDIKNHPDFNIYYDIKMKRNYWVLGYFGGGA